MRPTEPITIAVGDLRGVIGEGLLQVLGAASGLRILDAGLDHPALEATLARGEARVVVLDEASVIKPAVPRRLRAARTDVGLVVLAHRPTRAYAARVLVAGVNVCLATDAPTREVVRGVRIAAGGRRSFVAMSPRMNRDEQGAMGIYALTRREREVLELLSRGHKNTEIAQALNISTETTRTHVKHLYHKLGVTSRRELLGHEQ